MITTCMFCGFDFDLDASPCGHGCPESRPKPSLIDRLTEDHGDAQECEHGFMLHRDPCPNRVCLHRDLAAAATIISDLHEAAAEAKLLIGARNDTLSATARQANVNLAWHVLDRADRRAASSILSAKPEQDEPSAGS